MHSLLIFLSLGALLTWASATPLDSNGVSHADAAISAALAEGWGILGMAPAPSSDEQSSD